jgi:hypothetical protein
MESHPRLAAKDAEADFLSNEFANSTAETVKARLFDAAENCFCYL